MNGSPSVFSYRSRMDIIANILENAIKGINKTKLMYSSNLSFTHFNLYVELLLDIRLLELKDGRSRIIIKTTNKGMDFLRIYHRIKNLLNE